MSKIVDELRKININLEYQSKLLELQIDLLQGKGPSKEMADKIKNKIDRVRQVMRSNPAFANNPKTLEMFDLLVDTDL